MKKILLGGLISSSLALLFVSILAYFLLTPQNPQIRDIKIVKVNGKLSSTLGIKDKVVVQKTTNKTNYLNSWKLSATIIGKNSFAMVLKGKDSRVLRLNDTLEGYTVKNIEKEKMLFSSKTDDLWLYIKTKKNQT